MAGAQISTTAPEREEIPDPVGESPAGSLRQQAAPDVTALPYTAAACSREDAEQQIDNGAGRPGPTSEQGDSSAMGPPQAALNLELTSNEGDAESPIAAEGHWHQRVVPRLRAECSGMEHSAAGRQSGGPLVGQCLCPTQRLFSISRCEHMH